MYGLFAVSSQNCKQGILSDAEFYLKSKLPIHAKGQCCIATKLFLPYLLSLDLG
jgi:hypothetical protein